MASSVESVRARMAIGKLLRNKIQVWPHEIWEGGNSQKWDDKSLQQNKVIELRSKILTAITGANNTENLRCKNCTANLSTMSRSCPFVFTEQGIYMLMTVLKGDLAVQQSMALIRLFKQMKDCIVEYQQLIGNAVRPQS